MTRSLNLGFTLAVLLLIVFFVRQFPPPLNDSGALAFFVGFVLLVASITGALAAQVGLPRLTGFLVAGILAGPSVAGLLPEGRLEALHLIDSFALALIALLAGGELKVSALRPQAKVIAAATLGVVLVVTLGVGLTFLAVRPLIPELAGVSIPAAIALAALLGVWSSNSSPDLTVGVIEDVGAKGPLTDVILGTTIVKDVVVIVLFTLTLSFAAPLLDPSGGVGDGSVLMDLSVEVLGSLVIGAGLGWVFSLYLGGSEKRPPLATFLFAYVIVAIAARLHLELLLTAVAAGFVIENLSPAGDRMIRGIESVSVVIFAFFFTIAGASLDLGALREFWLVALVLFAARAGFTYLGVRWGMRLASTTDESVRSRTWQGLVSQGGVTLGFLLLIQEKVPGIGATVAALGTAIIIGNILGGPVLLKRALTRPAE